MKYQADCRMSTSDYRESPHGRELMTARGVCYLQDHVPFLPLYQSPKSVLPSLPCLLSLYLLVGVLRGGDVGLPVAPVEEPRDDARLANT